MSMDWQNSINPFYTTSDVAHSPKPRIVNPLKIDTTNLIFNPSIHQTSTSFKPIPLPDDILGFDPLPMDMAEQMQLQQRSCSINGNPTSNSLNASFDLENYLKSDLNAELEADDIDNDFLDANLNFNNTNANANNIDLSKEQDIEKVLLDLGISEVPSQGIIEPTNTHKRKISGSGIFGFVGEGENTQLQIPGIEPVLFINKKPLYKDVTKFDNLNYNTNTTTLIPTTPTKSEPQKRKEKPDYYVSSGNPVSYKFPPSPPKGTFETQPQLVNIYSAQKLQSLRQLSKQKDNEQQEQLKKDDIFSSKSPLQTSRVPSPLSSVAMSSPLKNIFQTPKLTSPKKIVPLSQLKAQTQFQVTLNKQLLKESDDTTMVVDDDRDETISAMNTPLRSSKTGPLNDFFQTPSKIRVMKSWDQSAVQRKNQIFQERIRSPKKSPTRKKPTITSTLATGTLDQYFVGPIKDGDETKYICKFFDKEIQEPCNREFTRISNARAHIQTHLCDRPFVCHECQKAFVRNHDLRRHQKGHENVALNVCPCGKRFPRVDALKRHRLRNICVGGISKSSGISKLHEKEPSILNNMKESSKMKDKIIENMNRAKVSSKDEPTLKIKPQWQLTNKQQYPTSFQNALPTNPNDKTVNMNTTQQFNDRPLPSFFNTSSSKDIDLFDFNEIPGVDGNFSFNMDDSLVI